MSKCCWVMPDGKQCNDKCRYNVVEGSRKYKPYCEFHTNKLESQRGMSVQVYRNTPSAHEYSVEEFTCYECGNIGTCPFAFDLYNLDGDCLALK